MTMLITTPQKCNPDFKSRKPKPTSYDVNLDNFIACDVRVYDWGFQQNLQSITALPERSA
tara:strand:- start:720 stop:899 length:180 start_codon:yes stop_codon:yes gene_type:complete